jgi:hypothetical protein
MHQCLGENCTQYITYRFALCAKCEKRYGRRATEWPAWLRFLWNDIQRERRRVRKINKHEVPLLHE